MNRKWLLLLIVDVILVAALLMGARPRERADLVFVTGSAHKFLDPQRMSWMHDIRLAECLFEPLVRVGVPAMSLEPGVAERWEVSDDGLTYTFHLRGEGRWSNGVPVTAGDFVFTWRRALLPDLAADYTQLFWDIVGAKDFFKRREEQLAEYVRTMAGRPDAERHARRLLDEAYADFDASVGVKAIDDRTLVVTLARPVPYFLQLCAFITFAPVYEANVDANLSLNPATGQLVQDPYWTRPDRLVSNGAYVMKRHRYKRDVLLEANPHYWNRAAMGNASILELIVENPANAMMLYEAGEVDWLPDIPSAGPLAADLVARNRADVHTVPAAGTYFYNFNCRATLPNGAANPLADERVRRALSKAIDRAALVRQVARLGQRPALTFTPVGAVPGYEPPVEDGVSFDPGRARALLAEAGYDTSSGKPLTGLTILYNTGAGHENAAQLIRRAWKEHLGIDVALEGLEYAAFSERLKNGNFTISRAGWFGDYLDPTTFLDKFQSENGNNDAGYRNEAFDALLADAADELDAAKRMALLRQAETIMLRHQPIAPLYQYVNLHVYDPRRVRHIQPNPWNFRRLELVRVEHE